MHDTHLIEKISEKVLEICEKKKIDSINELCVGVHTNSHVTAATLGEIIKRKKQSLMGEKTVININRDQDEENIAVIYYLDGMGGS